MPTGLRARRADYIPADQTPAACGLQRGRVDTAGGRSPCHLHAFCIAPASIRVAVL